jgi:hypothetical protein
MIHKLLSFSLGIFGQTNAGQAVDNGRCTGTVTVTF